MKFAADPTQTGELLPAVGAEGIGFTVTAVVPGELAHPATETVTEYIPLFAAAALAITGFCIDEEKPFGPVQE